MSDLRLKLKEQLKWLLKSKLKTIKANKEQLKNTKYLSYILFIFGFINISLR